MSHRCTLALTALAGVLAASLVLNVALFRQADGDYREVNAVRLDPLGLSAYAGDEPPPAQPGQRRMVFFGDSRAQAWPAPALPHLQILNRGIGAQTSAQVLGRLNADVLAARPDVVVIQTCINDLKAIGLMPQAEEAIVAGCLRNLRRLVDDVRASGADVILTTVLPSTGDAPLARRIYWSPRIDAAAGRVNAELRRWAGDGVQVLDAAALLEDGRGQLRREYSVDLLHLNDAGYAVLNRELARLMAQSDH